MPMVKEDEVIQKKICQEKRCSFLQDTFQKNYFFLEGNHQKVRSRQHLSEEQFSYVHYKYKKVFKYQVPQRKQILP